MKFYKIRIFNTIARRCSFLSNWATRKQSTSKLGVSASVLDKRTPIWKPILLLLPALVLIATFTIVPMVLNIQYSFTDKVTGEGTFKNYYEVFTSLEYSIALRNSFIYGLLVLPFVMSISLIISSVIAKLYRRYAKGFWQTVFFMPYITNGVAVSLVFIQFFQVNGIFNHMLGTKVQWLSAGSMDTMNAIVAMMINGIWNGLAFNILIYTTAMMSVDKNLYKSASIDGSNSFKQFFVITLPSIKSTINFLITLGIIGGVKVFPLALFENNAQNAIQNGGSTLMLYVFRQVKIGDFYLAGASSISLFVIGVIFSSLVRGGFFAVQMTLNVLGENNVWVKVKNTKQNPKA